MANETQTKADIYEEFGEEISLENDWYFTPKVDNRAIQSIFDEPLSESGQAWREWFDAVGFAATVEVVNSTAKLVTIEREIYARKRQPPN